MSGGFIASARNPLRASYVQRNAALGGISLALDLGDAIIAAEPKGATAVIDAIVENDRRHRILAEGASPRRTCVYTKEAFDIGTVTLGDGDRAITLHVMNEYMAIDDAGGSASRASPT